MPEETKKEEEVVPSEPEEKAEEIDEIALDDLSEEELRELALDADIPNAENMSKDELIKALSDDEK